MRKIRLLLAIIALFAVLATWHCQLWHCSEGVHRFLIGLFRRRRPPNQWLSEYEAAQAAALADVRKKLAAPPMVIPAHPAQHGHGHYQLDYPDGMKSSPLSWSQFGQDRHMDSFIFKGKKNGFFVEIGGYDGEQFSNTLFLERERGWDGLLVEANPYTYDMLQSRDRNCWSINACT